MRRGEFSSRNTGDGLAADFNSYRVLMEAKKKRKKKLKKNVVTHNIVVVQYRYEMIFFGRKRASADDRNANSVMIITRTSCIKCRLLERHLRMILLEIISAEPDEFLPRRVRCFLF